MYRLIMGFLLILQPMGRLILVLDLRQISLTDPMEIGQEVAHNEKAFFVIIVVSPDIQKIRVRKPTD